MFPCVLPRRISKCCVEFFVIRQRHTIYFLLRELRTINAILERTTASYIFGHFEEYNTRQDKEGNWPDLITIPLRIHWVAGRAAAAAAVDFALAKTRHEFNAAIKQGGFAGSPIHFPFGPPPRSVLVKSVLGTHLFQGNKTTSVDSVGTKGYSVVLSILATF